MKRLFALIIALLLLAGCGVAIEVPEEPSMDEAMTVVTTTEETTTEPIEETLPALSYSLAASPKNPGAKPFTKDDIAAIEANFKTVGDYVKAVPAAWYEVICWNAVEDRVRIRFYDDKPLDNDDRRFLEIATAGFVEAYSNAEDTIHKTTQSVPKELLTETACIIYIDFAKTGSAIPSPRGLMVGDNAQKIFDAYPDYRSGDGTILYDITAIYPWAKPEWGSTMMDTPEGIVGWERELEYGFLGGRIWNKDNYYVTRFIFMEKPYWWDDREWDSPWASDLYSYHWRLDYTVEENIIQNIEFMLSYHPG